VSLLVRILVLSPWDTIHVGPYLTNWKFQGYFEHLPTQSKLVNDLFYNKCCTSTGILLWAIKWLIATFLSGKFQWLASLPYWRRPTSSSFSPTNWCRANSRSYSSCHSEFQPWPSTRCVGSLICQRSWTSSFKVSTPYTCILSRWC
jgi:hypothetical protein